jgi:hypothetical protein
MKVKLVIIAPEVTPNEFMLTLPTKIGRGHEATLKMVHPLISRVHCEFFEQDGQLMVRDLDSLNGTFVNQDRITEDTPLESNTTVVIGSAMVRLLIGDDADRMPPARGEGKVAVSAETLQQDTLQKIAKGGETVSDEELWEPSADEEPAPGDDATVDLQFEDEAEEPPAKPAPQPAPKPIVHKPAAPSPAKPVAQKPTQPASDSSDYIMPPLDEPAPESPKKEEGGDEDDFWNSIM